MGAIKKKGVGKKILKYGAAALAGGAVGYLAGRARRNRTGKRRSKGPAYWANKVLVEKLKKRFWRLKYGGR